ncbi:MAG TPA: hypothetical protein VFG47_09200, partial [Geminicoccaceae bacterium]|nr:hypothetical protein [Geminicoccaceae bacterium]
MTTVASYKGRIGALYRVPPEGGVVVCLDEMGPEGERQELSRPGAGAGRAGPGRGPRAAGRAGQEIDDGRRGKGYIFGAFRPATGEAFTRPYAGRGTASWVDFLEQVEPWLPAGAGRIDAIVDNLS